MVNPVRVQVSVAAPQSQQRRFSRVPAPNGAGTLHLRLAATFPQKKNARHSRRSSFFALLQNYRAAHLFFFRGVAARAARMKSGVFFLVIAAGRLAPPELRGVFFLYIPIVWFAPPE